MTRQYRCRRRSRLGNGPAGRYSRSVAAGPRDGRLHEVYLRAIPAYEYTAGPWLRLATHRATLSAQDERLWQHARDLIAAERFRPPRTRELARALSVPEPAMRGLLKRVQRMGRVIEVAPDQFFLSETVAEMAAIAASIAEEAGALTAASFRDRLANGRKVAILVLEFFDRTGLTTRSGDERRVRTDRLGMFGQVHRV